jgi:hypothetical protein
MKKLLTSLFTLTLLLASCHDHGVHAAPLAQAADAANLAGTWQLTIDTPHGPMKGAFQISQDGGKLTVTFESEAFGPVSGTGALEGKNISFSLTVPGADHAFTFSGTLDGAKMGGKTMLDGVWSASRE